MSEELRQWERDITMEFKSGKPMHRISIDRKLDQYHVESAVRRFLRSGEVLRPSEKDIENAQEIQAEQREQR